MTDGQVRPIAFLGPEGTFTAAVAKQLAPNRPRLACPGIPEVARAVRDGAAEKGVVPIENSIEGAVNLTLDTLAFDDNGIYITAETTVPVVMCLMAHPKTTLNDITEIRSHPVALPQCRNWLAKHLPEVGLLRASSTAEAAREVAHGPIGLAAIGPRSAAELNGLVVLSEGIQDRDSNATRFVVLGRSIPHATGADKTSLVVFLGQDRPGLLMRVLDEFALRSINLTKIESRPTKTKLGEYCIFLDASGHLSEPRMGEALRSVHRHVKDLRVFGSYPRVDGTPDPASGPDSASAYDSADRWYDDLISTLEQT